MSGGGVRDLGMAGIADDLDAELAVLLLPCRATTGVPATLRTGPGHLTWPTMVWRSVALIAARIDCGSSVLRALEHVDHHPRTARA